VTNIAAYGAQDPKRPTAMLFQGSGPGGSIRGSELLSNGLFVSMRKVPASDGAWTTAPYEAQYLKLHDVTP
jgi:hypothetical protein